MAASVFKVVSAILFSFETTLVQLVNLLKW